MATDVILVFNETQESDEMRLTVINAADGQVVKTIELGSSSEYYNLWDEDYPTLENPVYPILVESRFYVRKSLKTIHKTRFICIFDYLKLVCKRHREWNVLNLIHIW